MTIPRLELSAAVLETIRKELEIPVEGVIFWTDSTSVLQYFRNESRRFHTFVANRIEKIHAVSDPSQWRYVDTKSNPADEGSRGIHACEITEDCRWLRGPEFLWKADTEWPIMPVSIDNKDLEFKTPPVHSLACRATMMDVIVRYSTWTKLLKGLAWLLKFKKYLLNKRKGVNAGTLPQTLSLKELKQAEMEIIKLVQHQEFGDNLCCKNRGKSMQKLNPVVIDGILRVGGRICNAPIDSDLKHPIILPSNHHLITAMSLLFKQATLEYTDKIGKLSKFSRKQVGSICVE
ncbi:uncharacterized protein LOC117105401 [Anneissia japonica]|uniref:uncharacterized protein LOC117105401 n=1 Tax=Anneissia japonica TaxID=1529436 RepID=UPI0014254B57|nr:uncharacterized protein LOC117105401 [Anneissia japonica]